jgi:hypothetical protein
VFIAGQHRRTAAQPRGGARTAHQVPEMGSFSAIPLGNDLVVTLAAWIYHSAGIVRNRDAVCFPVERMDRVDMKELVIPIFTKIRTILICTCSITCILVWLST